VAGLHRDVPSKFHFPLYGANDKVAASAESIANDRSWRMNAPAGCQSYILPTAAAMFQCDLAHDGRAGETVVYSPSMREGSNEPPRHCKPLPQALRGFCLVLRQTLRTSRWETLG
jgi:hypothetical protein